jgi:methylthioribose-1-phosphate isomerase
VVNKIGTYLKALAAKDNGVPFYVALPSSTIDWQLKEGAAGVVIEERDGSEVKMIEGLANDNKPVTVRIIDDSTAVANYGFDKTPSALVTGLITERGIAMDGHKGIAELYPDKIHL